MKKIILKDKKVNEKSDDNEFAFPYNIHSVPHSIWIFHYGYTLHIELYRMRSSYSKRNGEKSIKWKRVRNEHQQRDGNVGRQLKSSLKPRRIHCTIHLSSTEKTSSICMPCRCRYNAHQKTFKTFSSDNFCMCFLFRVESVLQLSLWHEKKKPQHRKVLRYYHLLWLSIGRLCCIRK